MSPAAPTVTPGTGVVEDSDQKLDKPWKVIVIDDPVNLFEYVIRIFQKVFGYSEEKARRLTAEVHYEGRSVVWSGGREKAEYYATVLGTYSLWTKLEQDD